MSGQVPDSNKSGPSAKARLSDVFRNMEISVKKFAKNLATKNTQATLTYNKGTGRRALPAKYPKQSYKAPPSYPNYGQFYFHKKASGQERKQANW